MTFEKNKPKKLPFTLTDASGAYQTGKTVTATVSKDGGAFAATSGTVNELAGGAYVLSATANDLNGTTVLFRLTAPSAKDVFITGETLPLLDKVAASLNVSDKSTVGVYVTNLNGDRVINAHVEILRGQTTLFHEVTNTDSRAVFKLDNGEYNVSVTCDGYDNDISQLVVADKDSERVVVLYE